MSLEEKVAELLRADPVVAGLLPGGIYTDEQLGVEGLRRGEHSPCNEAFDADGMIVPCAVVRQSGEAPYGPNRNVYDKFAAMSQMVMVYFFEMRGHTVVDQVKLESYRVLEGKRLGKTYPIWMVSESPAYPDGGPVVNSTMLRQDWMAVFLRQG